ncbi:nucleotide exchange factor GrpE [Candidatus Roizmanbacteria bacterium RIFOXYB2_FULL_38_10]|uniref:Protein GrpE n=1 Tax=Candidatus Roizmanbacteria bacterium RIFOXYD1_FULL_38_12 TaxID=1802093 RepID=A0A1F7KZS2_9BACT|nr:MAG: nucleotide exchange factor GrpE [Candidatus Roizmanbacteria bacterium RIFOXYA2_FULL_38_14]OGK63355.1 MAG: nucleotide exchange factor GrpE [Candidatus Roizmanbacteria bacterium RIFOXYA1_FULL_37_12]OGK65201.1 MAG: nucleotide exchange factor GrpE [Candidatus Roizmanbacteria bacterium RIFOXYB1_FULL_40_23]OGK68755.1 MAG: nucleotide exchange factor GrpE [Candidatus Roizmanbacteria bacterium RIFOXYB2_FULL_38_10]OGK69606.1 MAG: nucleotide exchange factor GrpE [Candidatus Roizmanbacteria bacteri
MTDKKLDTQGKQTIEDQLKKMKEELEVTKKLVEENKSKYLRALADYQNLEKRVIEQKGEIIKGANKGLILRLLSFLDNLEKAEIFVKDEHLKLIKESFQKLLHEAGLREIIVQGKEYDPHNAEVLDVVEGEKEGVVKEVLRKGYELNGCILRVAQVKVTKQKLT